MMQLLFLRQTNIPEKHQEQCSGGDILVEQSVVEVSAQRQERLRGKCHRQCSAVQCRARLLGGYKWGKGCGKTWANNQDRAQQDWALGQGGAAEKGVRRQDLAP
jgi:hypothetical protein